MTIEREFLPFINPATGEQFGRVAMATEADVLSARKQMAAVAPEWAAKSVKERIRILRKLQTVMIDSVDDITEVINNDHGKSRQDALIEVLMVVDKLHQYYKNAPKWLKRRSVPPGLYFFRKYYTERKPFGVVAVIGPWNYPFDLTMAPVCSALLAGNVVLVKPSEVSAATGVMIEKLFQQVPELARYVRFLHGDGRVGAALVASKPDLVFLTGSTGTGRKIAQATAANMTPFLNELGGKDPMIVLENADIKAAAKWGVWGAFYNTGQTCMAVERVYVVKDVYDEFIEAVLDETEKYKVGYSPDIDNKFDMGPLTFQRQIDIVEDHLADAVAKGARIVAGGERNGTFMQPTVVVNVDHNMKLMCEETFGPVIPIMKVEDEQHAIQLANHSDFGLSACVWTRDIKRAERVGNQLEVGSVNVNDAIAHYPVSLLPFGGVKLSGNARTHGKGEVIQFTHSRSYAVGQPPLPFDVATVMRAPGHYKLGSAVLHFAFGTTPAQRMQPIKDIFPEKETAAKAGKVAAAVGVTAAFAAVVVGLFRGRKSM